MHRQNCIRRREKKNIRLRVDRLGLQPARAASERWVSLASELVGDGVMCMVVLTTISAHQ
jgi:hypothetical protein